MAYSYLFGPVASRRLGMSLGIDLVPHKTCMLDCVYCECGGTTQKAMKRQEYVPTKKVLDEIDDFLRSNPRLDYITFSGSGEPTLHSHLGEIADYIKSHYPHYSLALLTNGMLLPDSAIRQEIRNFDLIKISLDAVSREPFMKINRPLKTMDGSDLIRAYAALRKEFSGKIWMEIFLVPGVNDTPSELKLLKEAAAAINPDKVQLNTLDRPPAETWVKPLEYSRLQEIAQEIPNAEVIARKPVIQPIMSKTSGKFDLQILELIQRRPCTLEDMELTMGVTSKDLTDHVYRLEQQGKIRRRVQERGIFYVLPS